MVFQKQKNLRVTEVAPPRQRPPGAVAEAVFRAECIQCCDCVEVCPRQAIEQDAFGYPYMADPTNCSKCGLCADICMHEAIHLNDETRAGLQAVLRQGLEV